MFVIGGFSFLGLGYQVLKTGGWWSFKLESFIGFGDARKPVGYSMMAVGCFLLIYTTFGKWQNTTTYICPKCEETVEDIEGKDIYCPKCGTKMEPLKGFYERHPELKGKP